MSETKPKVIALCGSSRFPEAFELANMHLSLQGNIVIGLSCFGHADKPIGARFLTSDGNEGAPEKQALDHLHFRKIDLADGIFVVNVGGYIGSSTKREIDYARSEGKLISYMFPTGGTVELDFPEQWCQPADRNGRIWLVYLYSPERNITIFEGEDAESKARDLYCRAEKCGLESYLFAVAPWRKQ